MLQIHPKALVLLQLVELEYENRGLEGTVHLQPAAWYNGRERGVSLALSLSRSLFTKVLYITFGEHRNSDQLFVDVWTGPVLLNPPVVSNMPEAAYNRRRMFDYNEYDKVVGFIFEAINLFQTGNLDEHI